MLNSLRGLTPNPDCRHLPRRLKDAGDELSERRAGGGGAGRKGGSGRELFRWFLNVALFSAPSEAVVQTIFVPAV